MKLSIIIPVYNESRTLNELIRRVKDVKVRNVEKEIIIVDDFSRDGTREKLRNMKDKNVRTFFHKKNFGKGRAIRTGLKHATGNIIIIQDADLEYSPSDYPKLISPIMDGKAKVVYGSRFLTSNHREILLHYMGNKFLVKLTNLLFNTQLSDMETCYKVFKREVIKSIRLRSNRFEFESEITAKIAKSGYKIYEVPIKYKPRRFEEGKKISWRDGIKAVYYLLKYRFMD